MNLSKWLQKDRTATQLLLSLNLILCDKKTNIFLLSPDLTLYMCHFSLTFLHHVFSNVSSNCMPQKMQSHIGCIYLTFLQCAFSNVFSNCPHLRTHSHIGCICSTFLHYVFSNVSSKCLIQKRHSRIGCICVTFLLHYWFSQGNININPSFTNIIIFNMLIHHNQVGNVP